MITGTICSCFRTLSLLICPLLCFTCSQHALCHASHQMLHVCTLVRRQQCTKLAPGPGSDLVPCMSQAAIAPQGRFAAPCRSCICCIQSASNRCCPQLREVNYSDSETICTASHSWCSCMLVCVHGGNAGRKWCIGMQGVLTVVMQGGMSAMFWVVTACGSSCKTTRPCNFHL